MDQADMDLVVDQLADIDIDLDDMDVDDVVFISEFDEWIPYDDYDDYDDEGVDLEDNDGEISPYATDSRAIIAKGTPISLDTLVQVANDVHIYKTAECGQAYWDAAQKHWSQVDEEPQKPNPKPCSILSPDRIEWFDKWYNDVWWWREKHDEYPSDEEMEEV